LIPYDSFLIDPPWLVCLGFLYGKVTDKLIKEEDKKAKARKLLDISTLGAFYVTSISLYFNKEWTRWLWEMCKAESGRDWMINSGVFHFDHENVSPAGHVICASLFAVYPLALKLGYKLAAPKGCQCGCGCDQGGEQA